MIKIRVQLINGRVRDLLCQEFKYGWARGLIAKVKGLVLYLPKAEANVGI